MKSAAKWLRDHPSIQVVSRDRCGLYAQAVREGAPQAQRSLSGFIWSKIFAAIEEQISLSGRATGRAILSEARGRCRDRRAAGRILRAGRR